MDPALADEYLPADDVVMRHAVSVAAPAPTVWTVLHRADFGGAWYVRALLALRGVRRPRGVHRLTLDRLVVVRPFSGLIRHAMLRAIAREATRPGWRALYSIRA
jgi:hypothetical protein